MDWCINPGVAMRLKVLFHINEMERWPRLFSNISNFIKDVGQGQADIEVVANGAAVMGYVAQNSGVCGSGGCSDPSCNATTLAEQMIQLQQSGVNFAACNNALLAHGVTPDMLLPLVRVVTAGITTIAEKQAQGYAYIKP